MSSSNLIKLSGLAALVGGALLVLLNILEFFFFGGQPESAIAGSSARIIVEVLYILATILMILGLIGLYAIQTGQTGTLGLIGFVVAISGTVMISGTDWSAAFLAPWIVGNAPEILDLEPSGVFVAGYLVTLVLLVLGYFLFGLASMRAKVLPGGAATLLMVGAVLTIVQSFVELPFEVVVLGVAIAWMGYSLWSRTGIQQG